jgi:hypothetical protein
MERDQMMACLLAYMMARLEATIGANSKKHEA